MTLGSGSFEPMGYALTADQESILALTKRVTELEAKAAEVVAELEQCELGSANPYMAGIAVGCHNAADLITEKFGLK